MTDKAKTKAQEVERFKQWLAKSPGTSLSEYETDMLTDEEMAALATKAEGIGSQAYKRLYPTA